MAASSSKFAYGSKVEVSTDGSSYSTIGEVCKLKFPTKTRKSAKATHLTSDDQYTEAKPGMKETSDTEFSLNLVASQYATLDTYFEAGTILYWRFSVPLGTSETTPERWVKLGFIGELGGPEADPDDANVLICMARITRSSAKATHTVGA